MKFLALKKAPYGNINFKGYKKNLNSCRTCLTEFYKSLSHEYL